MPKGLDEIEVAIPEESSGRDRLGRDLADQWGKARRARQGACPLLCGRSSPGRFRPRTSGTCGWSADFPDPEGFLPPLLASYPIFRDEEITTLLGNARTCHDQDERIELFREVDRLLVAERCALLPTSYGATVLLRRPWVHGLRATPLHGASTPLEQVIIRR